VDPRLLSVHLEGNPRRDAFRAARGRVEHAAGGHTVAGEVRVPLGSDARDLKTLAPSDVPVKQAGTHCWLLDRGKQVALKIGLNSIVHSDLTIEIHDVASKNGTTVNGHKINGPTRLRDGDEIGLSERHLTFLMFSGQPTGAHSGSQARFSSNEDRTLAG
jgi:hypothetical protein